MHEIMLMHNTSVHMDLHIDIYSIFYLITLNLINVGKHRVIQNRHKIQSTSLFLIALFNIIKYICDI